MGFLVYIAVALAVQLLSRMAFGQYDLWSLKWWVIVMASLLLGATANIFYSILREIRDTLKKQGVS